MHKKLKENCPIHSLQFQKPAVVTKSYVKAATISATFSWTLLSVTEDHHQ